LHQCQHFCSESERGGGLQDIVANLYHATECYVQGHTTTRHKRRPPPNLMLSVTR
jgi:hypothetical protein